jgi:hypothetical protein
LPLRLGRLPFDRLRLAFVGQAAAQLGIVGEGILQRRTTCSLDQPGAQPRGADSVGFADYNFAALVIAAQGHREGKGDHQAQQAEHGGEDIAVRRAFIRLVRQPPAQLRPCDAA